MGASKAIRRLAAGVIIAGLLAGVGCARESVLRGPTALLTLKVEGRGSIQVNGYTCTDTCVLGMDLGSVATLTAVGVDDSELASWWTDCTGSEPTCEVEMDHDRHAVARFGFRTTVESTGSGTGHVVSDPPGINCPTDCTEVFQQGTSVTLTATPDLGSTVKAIHGSTCTTNPCTFESQKPETIHPLFYGGGPIWARGFGGSSGTDDATSDDHGYAVGIGVSGTVFVAGAFRNTVDFGSGHSVSSVGGSDLYLVTLDQDGVATDARRGGDTGDDALLGLTMINGDVYVAGYITDPTFGDIDSTVQRVTGNTWSSSIATGGNDFAIGMAPTGSEVAVTGQIGEGLSSNVDALLTGYAQSNGSEANRAAYGNTTEADIGYFAASDDAGNVIVVGQYTGQADFGGATLTPGGGLDGFIAKYNASRSFVWSLAVAGAGDDVVYAVGTDGMDVIVGGTFAGTVDFGGMTRTSVGSNDLFVARYDSNGQLAWVKTWGSAGDDEVFALAVDGDGSVVITGYVSGPVDFGDGPLRHAGGADVLVARLDASGEHLWSYTYGGSGDDVGYAVKLRADGQPVVAGSYQDTLTVGATELQSADGTDILVLRGGR